jgi:xylulokinase
MHNGGCALAGDPGAWRALAWYRDVLCDGERLAAELRGSALDAILCEAASTSQPGAGGVVFVTFGDRSALVGMSHDSDKADVSRAVLDGLAYTIADALPLEVKTLRVAGALADQSIWRQWLADVVGVPVCRTTSPASAAYGAAIIAAGGAAAREPEGISAAWVHPTAQATPDPIAHDKHRDARSLHRRLREALGRQLDALSRLDDERVNDRT